MLAYAAAHNVTKIVVGKPDRPRWRELLFGSVVDELIRTSGQIDIYVIRGDEGDAAPQPHRPRKSNRSTGPASPGRSPSCSDDRHRLAPLPRPSNSHRERKHFDALLLGVLWVATPQPGSGGLRVNFAVMAFDLTFVPPYHSFVVADEQYLVTFAVMLATALLISAFAAPRAPQVEAAQKRGGTPASCSRSSRELASRARAQKRSLLSPCASRHMFGHRTILLVPDGRSG